MELREFYEDVQAEVRGEILGDMAPGEMPRSPEEIFTELVMKHMAEEGITYEPKVCHYGATLPSKHKVKVSGYSVSDIAADEVSPDALDLFVSIYDDGDELKSLADSDVSRIAKQGFQFLRFCANGELSGQLDRTHDAYPLVSEIQSVFDGLDTIRIVVITNSTVKTRNYAPQQVEGKTVRLEVMDIQRLFNHLQSGKAADELVVNFKEICGTALPSVWVPGDGRDEYDYALSAIPAEVLRLLYGKYGPRILEANVRSFLGVSSKGVNKGIRDTLRTNPNRFMAYNNGIVIVAHRATLERAADGSIGLLSLEGLQIVNGGQTTASIYFAQKKHSDIDLRSVRVPAKIIVMRNDNADHEDLISNISKYANSQNVVKQSDLSANKPYHREMERLSNVVLCPDGIGKWFYERSTGSYKVKLEKEASTVAQKKKLQAIVPPSRRVTKPDIAKYIFVWDQKPYIASLGSQKNFQHFMSALADQEVAGAFELPDREYFKDVIAKCIIFKAAHKIIRPLFPAFQANITCYTISVVAFKVGDRFDLKQVWIRQSVSRQLEEQIAKWADEVSNILHSTSKGRMISEWAKKEECWELVRAAKYSPILSGIPEIKN